MNAPEKTTFAISVYLNGKEYRSKPRPLALDTDYNHLREIANALHKLAWLYEDAADRNTGKDIRSE
jgi:hypothetical protein